MACLFNKNPKKEIQKAADIPTKQWYTVKLNALVPVELRYKIQASSSDEAIEVVLKQPFKSQDAPPSILGNE